MSKQANNIEAEQAVLGTILIDPKANHFLAMLSVDDFAAAEHRLIFEACDLAAQDGRHATPVTLAPQFAGDRISGTELTVAQYLARLITVAVHRDQMPNYIRTLKEFSGRRALGVLAEEMAKVATVPHAQITPFLEHTTGVCDAILSGLRRQQITSFTVDELNKATIAKLRSKEKTNLIPTGIRTLDEALGGFGRGELNIIAGRPGQGKTTFALSAMRQAAKQGVSALFFSQEMQGEPVSARLLSDAVFNSQTPIPYESIIRRTLNDWDIGRLEDVSGTMTGLPILIDQQTALTVPDISMRARRYAERLHNEGRRLDVIWIDHLGYMQATDRYRGNKVYETGEITKGCRRLAKELGVAVNLLCQLSRKVEEREDKRPQSHDLRDSGNIEEDADCILMLYREAYYLANMHFDDQEKELKRIARLEILEHVLEIAATKTRNGGIFTRRFFADVASNAVRDLA